MGPVQKNAKAIMTQKLVTISMEDSVRAAYQLMQEHHFRHLAVIDANEAIIGILSDRDLQRAMISERNGIDTELSFHDEDRVKDYMAWPVECIAETTSVAAIAERMLKDKKSAFLDQGRDGKNIHGIVTTDDLLRCLIDFMKKEPHFSKLTIEELEAFSANSAN